MNKIFHHLTPPPLIPILVSNSGHSYEIILQLYVDCELFPKENFELKEEFLEITSRGAILELPLNFLVVFDRESTPGLQRSNQTL